MKNALAPHEQRHKRMQKETGGMKERERDLEGRHHFEGKCCARNQIRQY